MASLNWVVFLCSVLCLSAELCSSETDPRDVAAVNSLHISFNSPPLRGWNSYGGDPCGEQWEGVSCVFSNVTALKLNGMNLGGTLDDAVELFDSILEIDLSNNHIEGNIPGNFPPTLRNLSLAGNQFNGSIPGTLSTLTQLLDLSLSNNALTGGIPDSFQLLTSLVNLDLSFNNLSDILSPIGSLSALTSLHLQNNRLIGTLDILQDLPLQDLNVENNLFSGPIPAKLLSIPNFRRDGNPFNTTILPSPPAPILPSPPPAILPPSAQPPWSPGIGPSSSSERHTPEEQSFSSSRKKKNTILIAACGTAAFVLLGLCVAFPIYYRKRNMGPDNDPEMLTEKPSRMVSGSNISTSLLPFPPGKVTTHVNESYNTDLSMSPAGVLFTIATLQQCTNSFSEENFVGKGTLGSVYRAELPDKKLLAVKKLNATTSRQISDEQFLELVSTVSRIKHPNIVELVAHCVEHGQRMLVYEYCEGGTLHDALHIDEEIQKKLSWNKRIRLALGAARALQYLHEVCKPPLVHQDFKSANILLDYQLVAKVSDCGIGRLKSSIQVSFPFEFTKQVSNSTILVMDETGSYVYLQLPERNDAQGYGAPELESGRGSHSIKSDVYSFGIVMLELLTGRKSYDSSRARADQYLVQWAISKLHDIDSLSRMVDPLLEGSYPAKSLSRFADIISRCIQSTPEFRPAMSEVVQDLMQMI
ncbi:Protein STRUBBELIG-RECEPTOR FAMILY 8 [Linum perenne]